MRSHGGHLQEPPLCPDRVPLSQALSPERPLLQGSGMACGSQSLPPPDRNWASSAMGPPGRAFPASLCPFPSLCRYLFVTPWPGEGLTTLCSLPLLLRPVIMSPSLAFPPRPGLAKEAWVQARPQSPTFSLFSQRDFFCLCILQRRIHWWQSHAGDRDLTPDWGFYPVLRQAAPSTSTSTEWSP